MIVQVFCQQPNHLQTVQYKYPQFEESFRQMLKDAENTADLTKGSTQSSSRTKVRQTLCPHEVDLAVSIKLAPNRHEARVASVAQAYSRKQGSRGEDTAHASSTADGDEADSDSSLSGSSSDPNLAGKANGTGGHLYNSEKHDIQNGDAKASNGAFNTAAFSKKFSAKRPPGGKVLLSKKVLTSNKSQLV